jgi:hypothetical protein
MARGNRAATVDVEADDAQDVQIPEQVSEPTLEGMPTDTVDDADAVTVAIERVKVPKEMRPLFNEIARLSGTLSLARKAVYANDAERATRALALLEKQVPGAREMSELIV